MILFYNVVYVYVYLVGGGGHFHGWVYPTRSSGIRTVSVTVPTNQLDYCFSSGRFKG